jgi:predicted transcriptional regulator
VTTHHNPTHPTTTPTDATHSAADATAATTAHHTPPSASTARNHQIAYLLQQVMDAPDHQLAKGKANRFPRAVARELNLTPAAANDLRDDLVRDGYLRTLKKSGSTVYELTDKGKHLLPTLEQKPLPEGRKPLREGPVSAEVQLARKTFLLFQLFEADHQTLEQKEANRFREPGRKFLALSAGTANRLRKEMADQGMIAMTRQGRNATYKLTQAGIEFLGASSSFPETEFSLNGRVLNDLLESARESARQFQTPVPEPATEPVPIGHIS